MAEWVQLIITAAVSIAASSGFWGFIKTRDRTRTSSRRLLLVLAYEAMASRGMHYIERGSVTREELEAFTTDLWEPYSACGGNGVGKTIRDSVHALPLKAHDQYSDREESSDH